MVNPQNNVISSLVVLWYTVVSIRSSEMPEMKVVYREPIVDS